MARKARASRRNAGITIANKVVTIHTIFVLTVCVVFGAMNMFTGGLAVGIGIIAVGGGAVGITLLIKKRARNVTRGVILSVTQLMLLIVASSLRHELHGMFPLMLGSMAVSAVYFNKTNLMLQWVLIDISAAAGIFFKDFCYGEVAFDFLLKGILGMNVCAALIVYLVNNSVSHIDEAVYSKREAVALVDQVQEQINQTEALAEKQLKVVEKISRISETVSASSDKMLGVSDELKLSAEEQMNAVEEITGEIVSITKQTEDSLEKSEAASQMASKSSHLLNEGNAEIENMANAMAKIEEASNKIQTIVKDIQDISFQTNILALNASIEASKAGEAGKGFAVVADEVRTLAQKSSLSAKNTAVLVKESISAVEEGREIAANVLKKMHGVMEASEESAAQSEIISELTKKQTESLIAVRERMELISQTVSKTSSASEESAEVAVQVAEDAKKMNQIVKDYRYGQ
ncbi:MAG: methyl-accepting chemotaxis protein [Bacteroides sp.]|nr:methyl-accepting chemotaxis protein [Bacteroides sp.]